MPRISISYRRDDSNAITGRIFDRLVAHYGRQAVFRDIDNIPAGVDFRLHLERVLQETDVLIVVMGRKWAGNSKSKSPRISDPNDFVRLEVETALQRDIDVIPVLVDNARLPDASTLPESLRALSFRQALKVDAAADFDHHIDRLIKAIDRRPQAGTTRKVEGSTNRLPSHLGLPVHQDQTRACPEWGGYLQNSVAHYEGSYLVIRPTFQTPGNVYVFGMDIRWDVAKGGLVFEEYNAADAKHVSHQGSVWIPSQSVHLYLVSGVDGWLRSATMSFLNLRGEMFGILSTLHNVAGAMYLPAVVPVVAMKCSSLADVKFGELTAKDDQHEQYLGRLRAVVNDNYVKMILP